MLFNNNHHSLVFGNDLRHWLSRRGFSHAATTADAIHHSTQKHPTPKSIYTFTAWLFTSDVFQQHIRERAHASPIRSDRSSFQIKFSRRQVCVCVVRMPTCPYSLCHTCGGKLVINYVSIMHRILISGCFLLNMYKYYCRSKLFLIPVWKCGN